MLRQQIMDIFPLYQLFFLPPYKLYPSAGCLGGWRTVRSEMNFSEEKSR